MININKPIVPGKSIGGILLGDDFSTILEENKHLFIEEIDGYYDFGDMLIWEEDGKVDTICALNNYQGRIENKIKLESTIGEIMDSLGTLSEDSEENLIVAKFPGVYFEVNSWNTCTSNLELEKNLDIPVTEIYVVQPNK